MAYKQHRRQSSRPYSSSGSIYTPTVCSPSSATSSIAVYSSFNSLSTTTSATEASSPASRTHATCAYPSWPSGRALNPTSNITSSSSASICSVPMSRQSSTSSIQSTASEQYTSSYSSGASAFISDEDLLDPALNYTPARRKDLDAAADDCVAPGYHFVSGRPRPTGPQLGALDLQSTTSSSGSRKVKVGKKMNVLKEAKGRG